MLLFRLLLGGGGGRVFAHAAGGWEGEYDTMLREDEVFGVLQRWECRMIEDGGVGLIRGCSGCRLSLVWSACWDERRSMPCFLRREDRGAVSAEVKSEFGGVCGDDSVEKCSLRVPC